jgi:hypothetical protein
VAELIRSYYEEKVSIYGEFIKVADIQINEIGPYNEEEQCWPVKATSKIENMVMHEMSFEKANQYRLMKNDSGDWYVTELSLIDQLFE